MTLRPSRLVSIVLLAGMAACQCGTPPDDGDAGVSTDAVVNDATAVDTALDDRARADIQAPDDATLLADASVADAADAAAAGDGALADAAALDASSSDLGTVVVDAAPADAVAGDSTGSEDVGQNLDASSSDLQVPDSAVADAAAAADSAASDTTACLDPASCSQPGTARCQGNASQTCYLEGECHFWSAPAACLDGEICVDGVCAVQSLPDPATLAPPIDPVGFTPFHDKVAFLLDPLHPLQFDVVTGTLDHQRVAVVRGQVRERGGAALEGVRVAALHQAERGWTLTRADGRFDLLLHGGGEMVLRFQRADLLTVDRLVQVPWHQHIEMEPVHMVLLDSVATSVDLAGASRSVVASGSAVRDDDGDRTARLLFASGTQAHLRMPDGSSQTIQHLTVRATEYSVGPDGPDAMPAPLPVATAYTYCVEFSVDEAQTVGATTVVFDRPVINYTDNFLGFPVGAAVPTGYYDRVRAVWVPAKNGKVIGIVAENGGLAEVDLTGDEVAEDAAALTSAGITVEELARLAELYNPGDSLWRVAITHFTPWDHNWPYLPPDDARKPRQKPHNHTVRHKDPRCDTSGSVLDVVNQAVIEQVPLPGTPFALTYNSERLPGRRTVTRIPVRDDGAAGSLLSASVEFEVAGQTQVFLAGPEDSHIVEFEWDGLDGFGRPDPASQIGTVDITYSYPAVYAPAFGAFQDSFGAWSDASFLIPNGVRQSIGVGSRRTFQVPNIDARRLGLGGWSLSVHHQFDPVLNWIIEGNGQVREVSPPASAGDIVYQTSSTNHFLTRLSAAPDGSVYAVYSDNNMGIVRVAPDGSATEITGFGNQNFVEEGPAAARQRIPQLGGVVVEPDGSLVYGNGSNPGVVRITPDGIQHRVVGAVGAVKGLARGPDGSFYFYNDTWTGGGLRRLDPEGVVRYIGYNGIPNDVAIGPRGRPYWNNNTRVLYLDDDGVIRRIAGTGSAGYSGDGGPAKDAAIGGTVAIDFGSDGNLYLLQQRGSGTSAYTVLRMVDAEGLIHTVLGGPPAPGGKPAIAHATDFAFGPDNTIFVAEAPSGNFARIRKIQLWGWRAVDTVVRADDLLLPSRDGKQLYVFAAGHSRHKATLDIYSGNLEHAFEYNEEGLLMRVRDGFGNLTTIERDLDGTPLAIEAPGGQRTLLSLDVHGMASRIEDAQGHGRSFEYDSGGLLQRSVDEGGAEHLYGYDADGLLTQDTGPDGEVTTITASADAELVSIQVVDPANRISGIEMSQAADGALLRTRLLPDGSSSIWAAHVDGSTELIRPDGTSMRAWYAPDPRWGMLLPVVATLQVSTPGGLSTTRHAQRDVTWDSSGGVFTTTQIRETHTIDGASRSSSYDVATRTWTVTSASGEQRTMQFGSSGELLSLQPGSGLEAMTVSYNALGQTTVFDWGGRSWTQEFSSAGPASALTNPLDQTRYFDYDNLGRLSQHTLASGKTIAFAHDAYGQVSQIDLPGGAGHQLGRDRRGNLTSYLAPGAGAPLGRSHDDTGRLLQVDLPGGRRIAHSYDVQGRHSAISGPETAVELGYTPEDASCCGGSKLRWSNWTDTARGVSHTQIHSYDGFLTTATEYEGVAPGMLSMGYGARFLPVSLQLSSGADIADIALGFDADAKLSNLAGFAITRAGPGRRASVYDDGTGELALSHDSFGRLTGKVHSVGGVPFYQIDLVYDDLDRVTERVETLGASQTTTHYSYDLDGNLTRVERDSVEVEAYGYDARGNRVSVSYDGGSAEVASYDLQDRLLQRGVRSYTVDADGYLQDRDGEGFVFAARGELLEVTVSASTVHFVYDSFGRRVARQSAGGDHHYYYGWPGQPFRPLAARTPDGLLSVYLYDEDGRLLAIDRAGVRHYVGSDHLGSPRFVVDPAGQVVKELRHDSWGVPLFDSDPGFDIGLGFAGGLTEPATGLVRFGLRDYEPETGRWTARDPVLFAGKQTNLYAYVGNRPTSFTDPSGLLCVGGSLYELVGGGGELCINKDGVSACAEVGFGMGSDLGLSPFGDLAEDGTKIKAEASLEFGPIEIGANWELNDCGKMSTEVSAGTGWGPLGVEASFDGEQLASDLGFSTDPEEFFQEADKLIEEALGDERLGAQRQGKVAAEGCTSLEW